MRFEVEIRLPIFGVLRGPPPGIENFNVHVVLIWRNLQPFASVRNWTMEVPFTPNRQYGEPDTTHAYVYIFPMVPWRDR